MRLWSHHTTITTRVFPLVEEEKEEKEGDKRRRSIRERR